MGRVGLMIIERHYTYIITFIGLLLGKDIVFRFIIEYSSSRNFDP